VSRSCFILIIVQMAPSRIQEKYQRNQLKGTHSELIRYFYNEMRKYPMMQSTQSIPFWIVQIVPFWIDQIVLQWDDEKYPTMHYFTVILTFKTPMCECSLFSTSCSYEQNIREIRPAIWLVGSSEAGVINCPHAPCPAACVCLHKVLCGVYLFMFSL
jgi:hypothetical protein